MFKQKIILLTANLFLVSGLALPKVVPDQKVVQAQNSAQAPVSLNGTEAELISIAEAALKAENDILVNGNEIAALKRNPRASKAQSAFQKRFNKARNVRAAMAAEKIAFTNFKLELKVKSIQIDGDTASLEAKEIAVINKSVEGKPTEHNYSYSQDHRFAFILQNGQWILSSDKRINNNQEEAANPSTNNPGNNSNQDLPPLVPVGLF